MPPMWVRLLALLLAGVFALPGCMTMMLWQPDRGVQGGWSDILTDKAQFLRSSEGGPLLAVDTSLLDRGIVRHLRPAGEPGRRWLLIHPVDHPETLTQAETMFAGLTAPILHLQRELSADGLPRRDTVGFWLQSYDKDQMPPLVWDLQERRKYRGIYGNSYEISVPCRLEWSDEPPGPLVSWPNGRIWCDIGKPVRTPTGELVLRTPLTVLGDLVLLPFEMLTIFSWW